MSKINLIILWSRFVRNEQAMRLRSLWLERSWCCQWIPTHARYNQWIWNFGCNRVPNLWGSLVGVRWQGDWCNQSLGCAQWTGNATSVVSTLLDAAVEMCNGHRMWSQSVPDLATDGCMVWCADGVVWVVGGCCCGRCGWWYRGEITGGRL